MSRHAAQPLPYIRLVRLDTMTKLQLTKIYNYLSRPSPPVPEFRMHSTALRRVDFLLDRLGQVVVDHDTGSPDATEVIPGHWVCSRDSLPPEPAPPRSETRWRDGLVMRLRIEQNPKRHGSASWQRWNLLRDGMTVGEYLDACDAAGHGRKWRGDVIFALERGFIEVFDEEGAPVRLPPRYADLD